MKSKIVILICFAATIASAQERRAYVDYTSTTSSAALPFLRRGLELEEKGDTAGARRALDEAIRLDPKMWPGYYDRALLFKRQHKWQEALQDLNAALRLRPTFLMAAVSRADINLELGNYAVSIAEINKLINFEPGRVELSTLLMDRAWIRATSPDVSLRNGGKAVADAKQAYFLSRWTKKNASFLDTLAVAYAEAGDFDSALRYEEQAISAPGVSSQMSQKYRSRLTLFKQHHPLRYPSK